MVEDFLELGCCIARLLMSGEIRLPALIDGIEVQEGEGLGRVSQLVRSGSLEGLDGLPSIVAAERKPSVDRRQVVELHQRILRKVLG